MDFLLVDVPEASGYHVRTKKPLSLAACGRSHCRPKAWLFSERAGDKVAVPDDIRHAG
jgi:hypothetical protein